jgi:chromosome segregation ATPase
MSANLSRAELLEMALSSEAEKSAHGTNGHSGNTGMETSIVPAQSEPARRADGPQGVSEMHTFLEHRSRQWSAMLRLQEQQRLQLQALEAERDAEYKRLEAAVDAVQKALRGVRATTDMTRDTRNAGEAEKAIELNRTALDQLETVAANLNTNFLAWRAAWQQHAQSLDASKRIRADMEARMMARA